MRERDRGDPCFSKVRAEHKAYISALRSTGAAVQVLPVLCGAPDAVFVEDPALVFSNGAILLRSIKDERSKEASAILPSLLKNFNNVQKISNGYVDGGDILHTPKGVIIGLSKRTTIAGAKSLKRCLKEIGEKGCILNVPTGVLHLKSDCSLLDEGTILLTKRLTNEVIFSGLKQVVVPSTELGAANSIRIGDKVLMGEEYPQSIRKVRALGFSVLPLPTSEIGKIDGGLSCMSLRWRAN